MNLFKGSERTFKVLVVDDDPVCLTAIEQLLITGYNCFVDAVSTPEEALNKIYTMSLEWQPKWYDLVLLDIEMPIVKGNILAKIIRQTEENMKDVPIIGVSGVSQRHEREWLTKYMLTAFSAKPITADKIKQIVENYL